MKDILEKSKKAISKLLVGAVYGIVITLSTILLVKIIVFIFKMYIMALIACITISVPIVIVSSIVQLISENIEFHKLKKEILKSLHEKNEYQKDYAMKRVNSIKIIKDQNNETFYAEEFIPVNRDELDIIKSTIPENSSPDIDKISAYETIQDKILKETNKSNLEKLKQELIYLSSQLQDIDKIIVYETIQDKILKETDKSNLEKLKQELIYLSFQLQDIATAHNIFLQGCETSEEIYEKRDVLRKIKTINN